MEVKKSGLRIIIYLILILLLAACASESPQTAVPSDIQVTDVDEGQLVVGQITQIKTFNQCDSTSAFSTSVEFNDSSTQTTEEGLALGLGVTGGVMSPAAKLEVTGSIEKHFSKSSGVGLGHNESASIQVPAGTQQSYTIVWEETRQEGTVTYTENGESKSASYSYRIGLQLVGATGIDIPCPTPTPTADTDLMLPAALTTSNAPVILGVRMRQSGLVANLTLYADIQFQDLDGDSNLIKYEIVDSTTKGIVMEDDPFSIAAIHQQAGAVVTTKWKCLGQNGGYTLTFNVTILDSAGNKSNPYLLKFDCRN